MWTGSSRSESSSVIKNPTTDVLESIKRTLAPYKKLAPFLGIGAVIVAIALVYIVFATGGNRMELAGSVLKIRTLPLDENSSAAIVDFRVRNTSDYLFVVRTVEATMVIPSGNTEEGSIISEVDARRLFEYYPVLGQKFNATLLPRDKIAARASVDRMVAVRFEVPEKLLQQRKDLRVKIVDVGSPVVSEVVEKPQP